MKITQNAQFQPITIVLETPQEAQRIWDAVEAFRNLGNNAVVLSDLCRWFSNKAQFGENNGKNFTLVP